MRYLLDTNALSEPIKQKPNQRFMATLQEAGDQVAISSVTWHEACFGAARLLPGSRRRADVSRYLRTVVTTCIPILPYDQVAAAWHAAERARLVGAGLTPPFADGQIAAVAATRNLVLVTANVRDFAAFDGLRVESWL